MNEDMTILQRKLFKYLKGQDDYIVKQSVGFRDGRITFIKKENALRTTNKWSKIETLFDLGSVHPDLEVNFADDKILEALGVKDRMVNFNLE